MHRLKPFLVFLLFVLVSGLLLTLLVPTSQRVEKTVTINAPTGLVYDKLSKLEQFNQWSVWSSQDSLVKFNITGQDGTPGAISSWSGIPEISGEGSVEITGLEPGKKVEHEIRLIRPRKIKAGSVFVMDENKGTCTVTWIFTMKTPRPWNIFNLFHSLDREMGHDFEKSLMALKESAEALSGYTAKEDYTVHSMDFPATRFATIRQRVNWTDISSFFGQHLQLLYQAAGEKKIQAGTATGLYFEWDEKNRQTDMAAAIPVPTGAEMASPLISLENIPASKAIYVNYEGAYDHIGEAHDRLDKYLVDKKLKKLAPVIEQYLSGPFNEKDTVKWLTKVLYLVE